MPITINGTTDARIGFMQTSVGGLSVDFDGTYTQVGGVVGSMNPTLGGLSVSFQGQYSASASFDGAMNLALGGISVNFIGNQIQNIDGLMLMTLGGLTVSFQDSSAQEAWQTRSTQPGVVTAVRFDSEAEITNFTTDWQGNTFSDANHVSLDTTNVASGTGSMRFDILKTDGASHGQWRWPFGTEFAEGETFYVQFRQYIPQYYRDHVFSGTQFGGPYAAGWKQVIISNNRGSNQLFEVVLQNTRHRGLVQGYNRNSNGDYLGFEDAISTICSGADFVYQNQIDRGPPVPTTCLEERQKRGGLFSYGANTGAPDPETGAFIFYPDEWVTYYMRIAAGTFGQGSSVKDTQIDLYCARDGDTAYTHLHSELVNLGAKESADNTAFNALWLLPYNTDGTSDAGRQDTYTLYDEVIVSTNPIAVPTAAIGNPTPSWMPSVGEIAAIGSNTLDNVVDADLLGTSGHIGTAYEVMANWAGGALVYKSGLPYLFVNGGGHGSCSINGIYSFGPLTSDTPVWAIEKAMSRTAGPSDADYYSDGQPNSTHNYNQLVGVDDSMWMIGFDGKWSGGFDSSAVDKYDSTAGSWDGSGSHPSVTRGSAIHGSTAYADGKIYYVGGNNAGGTQGIFTIATNTWQSLSSDVFLNYPASCYDSARSRIVTWVSANQWRTTDTATNAVATGSTNSLPGGTIRSLEYDPDRDRYVMAGRGNRDVYELHPTTWQWSTRSFTGATPVAGHTENNGHYGRFRYVPELKGYIYAPSQASQVYFYRSAL